MSVELATCQVCGKNLPIISMSRVDNTICARCASKAIARVQSEDGSWYDEGIVLGVVPWEQFPSEPRSAHRVFSVYRDAYPIQMTTRELSEKTGYGLNAIRHWMDRWKWKQRFFEWAQHQDKLAMVEQATIRTAMNDRQILITSHILDKALDRLDEIDISELTPMEAIKWAEIAAKMERTAIDDNRAIVEANIEKNSYSIGTAQKKEESTQNKGMEEILKILADSGAINIQTLISTPKVVDNDIETESVEYEDATENVGIENENNEEE